MAQNKRNSSVELLRIVSMLMIIMHHYAFYGVRQYYDVGLGSAVYLSGDTLHKVIEGLMTPGGVIGVAIFFIIAGYYGIESDAISSKLIKNIVLPVLTFSLAGTGLWYVLIKCNILTSSDSIGTSFAKAVFPLSNDIYWFASAYIIIMLVKPLLNKLVRGLSFGKAIVAFTGGLLCYAIMYLTTAYYIDLWIGAIFYCAGAILKLHRKNVDQIPKWLCFALGTAGWVGYYIFMSVLRGRLGVLIAVCIMGSVSALGFSEFSFRQNSFYSRKINYIASLTFGVYLMHEHPLLREFLWEKIFHVASYQYQSNMFPLYAIATILAVFLSGCLIEMVRKKCTDSIGCAVHKIAEGRRKHQKS